MISRRGLMAALPPGHSLGNSAPVSRNRRATSKSSRRCAGRRASQRTEWLSDCEYVWSYLPDMSRRWGEMEAKPSMIWIQHPGTAAKRHLSSAHTTEQVTSFTIKRAEDGACALI